MEIDHICFTYHVACTMYVVFIYVIRGDIPRNNRPFSCTWEMIRVFSGCAFRNFIRRSHGKTELNAPLYLRISDEQVLWTNWMEHIVLQGLFELQTVWWHYNDVIMGAMASQITSLTIIYLTVYSSADQRQHQSSASLAFVWWIYR